MELKKAVYLCAKSHIDKNFDEMAVDIPLIQIASTCLGFVDGLFWAGLIDEDQANDLARYIYDYLGERSE